MSKNDGGPAFPRAGGYDPQNGMALRDYFAAKAMAAVVAITAAPDSEKALFVAYADAMLAERSQRNESVSDVKVD